MCASGCRFRHGKNCSIPTLGVIGLNATDTDELQQRSDLPGRVAKAWPIQQPGRADTAAWPLRWLLADTAAAGPIQRRHVRVWTRCWCVVGTEASKRPLPLSSCRTAMDCRDLAHVVTTRPATRWRCHCWRCRSIRFLCRHGVRRWTAAIYCVRTGDVVCCCMLLYDVV
jgi:hypothetical protein